MNRPENNIIIQSLADLKREERSLRLRIRAKEEELQKRLNHIPGELFYSGVDNFLPNIIKGKVSSFALNTGKGIINSFFLQKMPSSAVGIKILQAVKPSGFLKKAQSALTSVFKKKKI